MELDVIEISSDDNEDASASSTPQGKVAKPKHPAKRRTVSSSSSVPPSPPKRPVQRSSPPITSPVNRSSPPITSPIDCSQVTVLRDNAREGIRAALQDPSALERSSQQLDAIMEAYLGQQDYCVILPTGGGKSLIWQAIAKLFPNEASLIVAPFVALLNEQIESSQSKGIVSARYLSTADPSRLPIGVQNIFLQPESGGNLPVLKQ